MAWISDVLLRLGPEIWVHHKRHPAINRVIHYIEHMRLSTGCRKNG